MCLNCGCMAAHDDMGKPDLNITYEDINGRGCQPHDRRGDPGHDRADGRQGSPRPSGGVRDEEVSPASPERPETPSTRPAHRPRAEQSLKEVFAGGSIHTGWSASTTLLSRSDRTIMMCMHEPSRTPDRTSSPVWPDLVIEDASDDEAKDPLAVEFGRRGGLKAGAPGLTS